MYGSNYGASTPSSSKYGSSYGQGTPNQYGAYGTQNTPSPQAQGSSAPARLRNSIRKAFADCEGALSEWDEAHKRSLAIIEAVSNAASRFSEFPSAEGELGVISMSHDAERLLKVRLSQSMERLLAALPPVVKTFDATCDKVQQSFETVLKDMQELESSCTLEELWEGRYIAQPAIGEMVEWLQDMLNSLRKEAALRQKLISEVGFEDDECLARALDLWTAGVFYSKRSFSDSLDRVKIHGAL